MWGPLRGSAYPGLSGVAWTGPHLAPYDAEAVWAVIPYHSVLADPYLYYNMYYSVYYNTYYSVFGLTCYYDGVTQHVFNSLAMW